MATVYKVLGQVNPAATIETTLYTPTPKAATSTATNISIAYQYKIVTGAGTQIGKLTSGVSSNWGTHI